MLVSQRRKSSYLWLPSEKGVSIDLVPQMNKDGTHRIYIQPMAGGNTTESHELSSKDILARAHVTPPGVAQNVRDALKESVEGKAKLVIAKT